MNQNSLQPWEYLQKMLTWDQLGEIHNKRILDFGSGEGITASHFAADNEVVAIEPNNKMLAGRITEFPYTQLQGDGKLLKEFDNEFFDVILCHNVFEYAADRENVTMEFARLLKKDGILSILKHNRAGRVMQMVVLLNNFKHAEELLQGKCSNSENYGNINYYDDLDILKWSPVFEIEKVYGMRTFWDLQQNQEIHQNEEWQQKMLAIEHRVSELEEYRAIAFLHHLIFRKK